MQQWQDLRSPVDLDPPHTDGDSGNGAADEDEDDDDGDVAGPRVEARVKLAKTSCA